MDFSKYQVGNLVSFDMTDPYDDDAPDEGYVLTFLDEDDVKDIDEETINGTRYFPTSLDKDSLERFDVEAISVFPKEIKGAKGVYFMIDIKVDFKNGSTEFTIEEWPKSYIYMHEVQNAYAYYRKAVLPVRKYWQVTER